MFPEECRGVKNGGLTYFEVFLVFLWWLGEQICWSYSCCVETDDFHCRSVGLQDLIDGCESVPD
jgi:hypothetical protein